MHTSAVRLVLLLLLFYLTACGKPQTPDQVAAQFWEAVSSGDASKVKKHVSAKDKVTLQSLDDVLAVNTVTFGKIVIDGSEASVDTTVTLAGNRSTDLPISTHLMLENEQWVVDYERTMQTIVAAGQVAAVINQFKDIGSAIKESIGHSVNEFQKAIPALEKELSNMEKQIEESVPKLKSRFEKFSRDLEQALNAKPGATDESPLAPETPESSDNSGEANPMPRLSEELSQIEAEILKAVPELKEQIHGFVEQLQEALKMPIEPQGEEAAAGEPIEI